MCPQLNMHSDELHSGKKVSPQFSYNLIVKARRNIFAKCISVIDLNSARVLKNEIHCTHAELDLYTSDILNTESRERQQV